MGEVNGRRKVSFLSATQWIDVNCGRKFLRVLYSSKCYVTMWQCQSIQCELCLFSLFCIHRNDHVTMSEYTVFLLCFNLSFNRFPWIMEIHDHVLVCTYSINSKNIPIVLFINNIIAKLYIMYMYFIMNIIFSTLKIILTK